MTSYKLISNFHSIGKHVSKIAKCADCGEGEDEGGKFKNRMKILQEENRSLY